MEKMKAGNIKSKYILKKIFDILPEIKMLNIIRYNKNIQKLLNISIEDYEKNGIIEIEIIPSDDTIGKFISINEELSQYYHVYFDDNTKEAKNTTINIYNAKKIKVVIDHQVDSLKGLFKECHDIKKIEFTKCYRNNITNMSEMFFKCIDLKNVDISKLRT